MSEDVWSERDTNPDAIEAALREMLRERHAANEALAPARQDDDRIRRAVGILYARWDGAREPAKAAEPYCPKDGKKQQQTAKNPPSPLCR